ncbi:MAG: hypothetical protein E5Y00_10365 [Mesorhizobium sp.]|nr:MAG: hypothetical protein E5Y00_10365 [Mesorhizobium sp.]
MGAGCACRTMLMVVSGSSETACGKFSMLLVAKKAPVCGKGWYQSALAET